MRQSLICTLIIWAFILTSACESVGKRKDTPGDPGIMFSSQWPVLKTYEDKYLDEVAMPLGGIGTGTVSIGGRGDLRDWELMNRGALGWIPGFKLVEPTIANAPFFALYFEEDGKEKGEIRLLEGPISESKYYGDWGCDVYNAGFPRFEKTVFAAAYPLAQISFEHKDVPLIVTLEAFNPLIPGDEENSSLPVAILRYRIKNPTDHDISVSVCGMIPNFIGTDGWDGKPDKNENEYREGEYVNGIYMYSNGVDPESVNWGNMALTTIASSQPTYRTTWAELGWNWTFREFLDDFTKDGELVDHGIKKSDESFRTSDVKEDQMQDEKRYALSTPPATLAVKEELSPGEEKSITFLITWHFPNRRGWDQGPSFYSAFGTDEIVGNYYTTRHVDAWYTAEYISNKLNELEDKTVQFASAFCESDIPDVIKEAALFNVANLRCQTVFRTNDGYPFGFEGTGSILGTNVGRTKSSGWGFGTCFHVWNYESTVPFLFGDLAMKFREVEFLWATHDNGAMSHRVGLPLKEKSKKFQHWAADGQMGTLIKVYRDWQLSGNDDKLIEMWHYIKKAMSFAWTGIWDTDKNGVMEGPQHNTMDIDYHGPNPQMAAWYLGALRAAEEMAEYMGDISFASECRQLYKNGRAWIDENCFNGEYYEQIIPENHNRVAQLGKGCLVDQLAGQYLAHTAGLGYVLDKENVSKTLQSIMQYNFITDFNDHTNTFRSFGLGNESGLIMASYPHGELLDFPFPYYTETMTGFEYSTAVHMIYEGQRENGLKVFEAIRDRYDGKKRNPFNEGEYGHRYARAMAAWGGVLAWTGFEYSGVDQSMSFTSENGKYFWSNGYQYGTVEISDKSDGKSVLINVLSGELSLRSFTLKGFGEVNFKKGKKIHEGGTIELIVSKN